MSTETVVKKRKNASETVKRTTPEDDHRRKRRNRTTQSCLNCHTSKRMCDRKRPCGRCTQLGLTGLCVYEVDDPSRKYAGSDSQDEKCRLQQRVAELESVIRELKNKPHPRWVAGSDHSDKTEKSSDEQRPTTSSTTTKDATPISSTSSSSSPHIPSSPDGGGLLRGPTFSSRSSPFVTSALSTTPPSPSIADSSSIDTPSPLSLTPLDMPIAASIGLQSDYDLSSIFSTDKTGMDDTIFSDIWDRLVRCEGACDSARSGEHCGCLADPTNYNVVLELSLRLRKAVDALSRSANHVSPSDFCAIKQNIVELDRFTSQVLGNISTPPEPIPAYSTRNRALPAGPSNTISPYNVYARPNASGPTATVSPPSMQPLRQWEYKSPPSYPSPPWEDSFMSWIPHRR